MVVIITILVPIILLSLGICMVIFPRQVTVTIGKLGMKMVPRSLRLRNRDKTDDEIIKRYTNSKYFQIQVFSTRLFGIMWSMFWSMWLLLSLFPKQ